MSWRTIYIESANKLSLNLNNLQVKYREGTYSISLDEIGMIIIDDQTSVITTRLLSRLCEQNITIVFTKSNKMPVGAIHPLSDNSRTAKINRIQLETPQKLKQKIWSDIIRIKISNQSDTLSRLKIKDEYLMQYVEEVELGDISNKEGQASRVYFKKLFGEKFVRFEEDIINYCLNYTYQIIRSKITQEVIGRGLHPPFGIFHRGEYNYFNLCDDLIEPYRPIADYYVVKTLEEYEHMYLTPELKHKLVQILNYHITIKDKKIKLSDSMKDYINSFMNVIQGKKNSKILYPRLLDEQQV